MNTFAALQAVTRRALKIPYESPLICQLAVITSASAATALSVLDILPTLQLAGPTLEAEVLEDLTVQLDWSDVPGAYAYIVYRATAEEGPYSVQVSGLIANTFLDNPGSGTFFYKVTGIEPNYGETTASNIVSVTVP